MQYKSPLLQSLQSNLRLQHLSRRTEAAYVYWTKRFVRFCGLRHPSELGPTEVREFLSHLVVERNLSAATQQQALSALLFLYRNVLGRELEGLGRLPRGRVPTTLPVDGNGAGDRRPRRQHPECDGLGKPVSTFASARAAA